MLFLQRLRHKRFSILLALHRYSILKLARRHQPEWNMNMSWKIMKLIVSGTHLGANRNWRNLNIFGYFWVSRKSIILYCNCCSTNIGEKGFSQAKIVTAIFCIVLFQFGRGKGIFFKHYALLDLFLQKVLEKGLGGGKKALSYISDQAESAIAVSPPSHQEAERKGNGYLKVRKYQTRPKKKI